MIIGIIVVEVCDGNLLAMLHLEELEVQFPEAAVLHEECLNHCGLCRVRPFALVNGERIFAKTAEECVELIKAKIVRELAVFH